MDIIYNYEWILYLITRMYGYSYIITPIYGYYI